jgi:hypothetical protein
MQIASDQKIYMSIQTAYPTPWLDAIDNPNIYGNGCNYHAQAVSMINLPGVTFPVFNDHIFVPDSIMHVAGYATAQAVSCVGSCSGRASATAFYGHPPYTYHWQPGNLNTSVINNLCPGTYYVTVTDSVGQSFRDSVQITLADTPQISIFGDTSGIVCSTYAFLSVNVTDWNVNYTYAWDSGQTWSNIYPTNPGTYTCTVTDPNGCKSVSSPIVLSFHPAPQASTAIIGDTLELISSESLSYQWYYDNTPITGAINYFYDSLQAGVYSVIATDTNGCNFSWYFGSWPTGISAISQGKITISPNPSFQSGWQLTVDNSLVGAPIEIYDSKGSLIFETKIESINSLLPLDVSRGVYFLHISSLEGQLVRKLIRL